MSRLWLRIVVVLIALFAAAQFIRPSRANPPIDPGRTLQSQLGTAAGFVAIVDRACRDCHSNATVWPAYSQVAPLSWLMAYGVAEGRRAVNFSEWGSYPPERQRELLAAVCRDASTGKMPGEFWTRLHPEARLSPKDIETLCAIAQQADRGRVR